jgi:hypothetical protein
MLPVRPPQENGMSPHYFCIAALFTWKLDTTGVSRMAGHSNYQVKLNVYAGTTLGALDRARAATE